MSHTKEPIYIIDATGLLVTCFHAVPRYFLNSKNQDISALIVTLNKIKKLVNIYMDKHVALVFDPPRGYFRSKLYPKYKANRKAPNPQLVAQIPAIKDLFRYLGFPVFCVPRFEADDVIGTIAKHFSALGHPITIESKDKDFIQLIDANICVEETKNESVVKYDITNGHERFNVPLQYAVDYLALFGDKADNIPSVLGKARTTDFINTYGGIHEAFALDNSRLNYLLNEQQRQTACLAYELAKIRTNVEFAQPLTLSQLEIQEVNTESLLNLLEEWELFKPLDEFCKQKHQYLKNYAQVAQELQELINSRPSVARPAIQYAPKRSS